MTSPSLALLALSLSGCALYFDDDRRDDAEPPTFCERHTATIFEPADGATVAPSALARYRWNEGGIPDRYTSLMDDYGNYFIDSTGYMINGDGSISETLHLPENGHYTLEIGWYCDAGNENGGYTVPLARSSFFTSER